MASLLGNFNKTMSEDCWWHVSEERVAYRIHRETKLEQKVNTVGTGNISSLAPIATTTTEPFVVSLMLEAPCHEIVGKRC